MVTQANGTAERRASEKMLAAKSKKAGHRITAGDDRVHLCWGKLHGTMRETKHRGIHRVGADFLLNLIAYNLVRIPKLVAP